LENPKQTHDVILRRKVLLLDKRKKKGKEVPFLIPLIFGMKAKRDDDHVLSV
jgi:hypothetical protein